MSDLQRVPERLKARTRHCSSLILQQVISPRALQLRERRIRVLSREMQTDVRSLRKTILSSIADFFTLATTWLRHIQFIMSICN